MKTRNYLIIFFVFLTFPWNGYAKEKIPKNIQWLTNESDLTFASQEAQKGGTYHSFLTAFPPTLRTVGPDSNSSFRSAILDNQMSLIGLHPNTGNLLPALATHWAFGNDKKTMFFKINPQARWSDGKPVTADDFAFTLEFMRSKHIIAPWYNDYYTKEIDKVIIYDRHTLAVVATKALPELYLRVSLSPTPRHFYQELKPNFVRKYNWRIVPNTGAYQITKIKKGKSITFERKKNWWAKELKYFRGRFNVDKVTFRIIRDYNVAFEYFIKGKLDSFPITLPSYWHQKTPILEIYKKGYVKRIWFYTDTPQPSIGFWLNQDKEIFQDRNVRYAFAHGINMPKLLQSLLRGDYEPLPSQYTGYGKYTNRKIKPREFNLRKVENLMKKSGWKRGKDGIWTKGKKRFSVQILYTSDPHTPRLVLLKEEAKKAGIELRLKRMDGSAGYQYQQQKKHEVAWTGYSGGLLPHFYEFYHSENAHRPNTNNITNTDNPEMDALIDTYRKEIVKEKRIALAHQIQEKAYAIGAFVPGYMVNYFRTIYWRWWKFPHPPATKLSSSLFEPFDTGIFWFDPKLKKETEEAKKRGLSFPQETIKNTQYRVSVRE